MSEPKPRLVLLHGRMITAENIAKMFTALTGRDPEVTPEWSERTNKELQEAYAERRACGVGTVHRVLNGEHVSQAAPHRA